MSGVYSEVFGVGGLFYAGMEVTRVVSKTPTSYRQVCYPDGTLELQGAYPWQEGTLRRGVEWRDLPVVMVNLDGQEIE